MLFWRDVCSAKQRIAFVACGDGHRRIEDRSVRSAAARDAGVADVLAGLGFEGRDLGLVVVGDGTQRVEPVLQALFERVSDFDIEDAGPGQAPAPPTGRVEVPELVLPPPIAKVVVLWSSRWSHYDTEERGPTTSLSLVVRPQRPFFGTDTSCSSANAQAAEVGPPAVPKAPPKLRAIRKTPAATVSN